MHGEMGQHQQQDGHGGLVATGMTEASCEMGAATFDCIPVQ